MRNKKSIELSMNFIVIIILSIVIFGFGIYFIAHLSSEAKRMTQMSNDALDKKIGDIICGGFDRVCISTGKKIIPKKSYDVFGVKVLNILEPPLNSEFRDFQIQVSPPGSYLGFDKDGNAIPVGAFQGLTIIPSDASPNVGVRQFQLKKNEQANVGFGVDVPADAPSGLYILNVDIKTVIPSGLELYGSTQKLYVEVP